MKVFIRFLLFVSFCGMANQLWAQNYRHSLKFNYGIANYNEDNVDFIQKPFENPFSLGLRFESDLSKAFSNSIGFSTYNWANHSSYSVQEMLFLRNNAKLLNRLRPQLGFGLGFEESKSKLGASNTYRQKLFIPLNVGFLTDLSNRVSLGIFGELKYGFDLKNFKLDEGTILPNNTAGISLVYRFSKVKNRVVYPEINWGNNETIISIDDLKNYGLSGGIDAERNLVGVTPVNLSSIVDVNLASSPQSEILMMKRIEPDFLADSLSMMQIGIQDSVRESMFARKTVMLDSLKLMVAKEKSVQRIGFVALDSAKLNSGAFTLSDFNKENSRDAVVFQPDLSQLQQAQTFSSASPSPYNYQNTAPVVYPNYAVPSVPQSQVYQPPVVQSAPLTDPSALRIKTNSTASDVLQGANVVGIAALTTQMSQLVEIQKQTLAVLNKQIEQNSPYNNGNLDNLSRRIDRLEKLIIKLDRTRLMADSLSKEIAVDSSKTAGTKVVAFCLINYSVNHVNLSDLQRNIIITQIYKDYIKSEGSKISIASFTDKSGSAAYNKKLSDARLKNVYQFLMMLGVEPGDIHTESFGDTKSSEQVNAEERRIELKLIKTQNGK